MSKWKEFLRSLTRSPRGHLADGRTLGLGLATAIENSRKDPTADVERFLRRQVPEQGRIPSP